MLERLSEEQVEAQSRLEGQCNEALAAAQANFEKTKQELANEKDKLEAELKVRQYSAARASQAFIFLLN